MAPIFYVHAIRPLTIIRFRISTGFVESAVNQVIAKRMEKKQQMRWTPKGAHLLLQLRTKVLNGEWKNTIREWHPRAELVDEIPIAA